MENHNADSMPRPRLHRSSAPESVRKLLRRRFSLAAKFNLVFVSLLVVTVVGVGGWMSWQVGAWGRDALTGHAFELADMFAPETAIAIYDR